MPNGEKILPASRHTVARGAPAASARRLVICCCAAAAAALVSWTPSSAALPNPVYSMQRYYGFLPASGFMPMTESRTSFFLMPPFSRFVKTSHGANPAVPAPAVDVNIGGMRVTQSRSGATAHDDLVCMEMDGDSAERKPPTAPATAAPNAEMVYVNRASGRVFRCASGAVRASSQPQRPATAASAETVPVKRRTEYDFIRFGRSAPPFREARFGNAPPLKREQQKKQDDKKASGQTYDYIRFGKRSMPDYGGNDAGYGRFL